MYFESTSLFSFVDSLISLLVSISIYLTVKAALFLLYTNTTSSLSVMRPINALLSFTFLNVYVLIFGLSIVYSSSIFLVNDVEFLISRPFSSTYFTFIVFDFLRYFNVISLGALIVPVSVSLDST